jgi:hypothetical protein
MTLTLNLKSSLNISLTLHDLSNIYRYCLYQNKYVIIYVVTSIKQSFVLKCQFFWFKDVRNSHVKSMNSILRYIENKNKNLHIIV